MCAAQRRGATRFASSESKLSDPKIVGQFPVSSLIRTCRLAGDNACYHQLVISAIVESASFAVVQEIREVINNWLLGSGEDMLFMFTKFAALTCAFYMVGAILLDSGMILMMRILGAVGVHYNRWSWLFMWGLIWLGSFFLAWRVGVVPRLARIAR
jgi:hypothetical protein